MKRGPIGRSAPLLMKNEKWKMKNNRHERGPMEDVGAIHEWPACMVGVCGGAVRDVKR